jgi:NADH-quinone oxidoreductase subunit M
MSEQMPKLAGIFALVAIASLGLPGLAGFWGEVMALLSSFSPNTGLGLSTSLFRGFMIAGGIGTILTAGYFLWMLQRVNLGMMPERWKEHALGDVLTVEWVAWIPLLMGIVVLGLYPRIIFGVTDEAVRGLMSVLGGG